MPDKMSRVRRNARRHTAIIVFFCFVCVIFFARLINLQIVSRDTYAPSSIGATVERVYIESVRGNICDRNGTVLVTNETSYNFVVNYETMPEAKEELNRVLLQAVEAMKSQGVTPKEGLCPFVGTYPNIEFSPDFIEGSDMYDEYVRLLEQNYVTSKFPIEKALELSAIDVARYYTRRFDIVKEKELSDGGFSYESEFTEEDITELIRLRYEIDRRGLAPDRPFILAEDVDYTFSVYVGELAGIAPGLKIETETKRVYKYPGYASHILGLTGRIYAEDWDYYRELGYDMDDRVGISGCEAVFEEYLRGTDGIIDIHRDEKGEVVLVETVREAVAGKDVWLTIDIETQIAAEDALKENIKNIAANAYVVHGGEDASSGAVVATDPNNGQLLAIASYPTYDLTTYNRDYNDLSSNPDSPLLNRALQTTLAPGSTFKVGVAAAALETGTIDRNFYYTCHGYYDRYDKKDAFKCAVHPLGGSVREDVFDALSISCNCFFYEMGHLMTIDTLNSWSKLFGLGQSTGIELYEKTGILAGREFREANPNFCAANGLGEWMLGDTWQAAIGQSENAFTPLQVSVYISTVINGGKRYAAHLLHSVHSFEGELVLEKEAELLSDAKLSSSTVSLIRSAMNEVISGDDAAYYIKHNFRDAEYEAGGKTGTAQAGSGASNNAWFTSFAPLNSPKITVTCMIEHGYSGSYASYTAREVIDAYLLGN